MNADSTSMKHASVDVLEFEALRELLGRYVASPLGRAELEKVQPRTDRARLEEELAEAEEATGYLRPAGKRLGNSARCSTIWPARSGPTAQFPITPALRWGACGATSRGRRSPYRTLSNASCARTMKKACCKRNSSPSVTSASWFR